jgi:hypothetical protein
VLQAQNDAHPIDQGHALIQELLVGNLGVDELLQGFGEAAQSNAEEMFT